MKSMTGYGRGEYTKDGITMIVEIRAVNSRFLDLNLKTPRLLNFCEDKIRKQIGASVLRGKLDVFINYIDVSQKEKEVLLDEGLLKGYLSAVEKAKEISGVKSEIELSSMLRFPDIFKNQGSNFDEDVLFEIVTTSLASALENLVAMRSAEGESLKADILARVAILRDSLEKIKVDAPKVAKFYREKLMARLSSFEVEIPEERIAQEVCIYTDKSNIDEEITRLAIHFDECEKIMAQDGGVGRKLDFLIQEFNRETNTICSKSNDSEITKTGLVMKNEIEKIREQIQNIE
ncbi:MAG: YicC/YloC family endoribonuclease [Bacillota bacterium]